jgi:hypothetical protein
MCMTTLFHHSLRYLISYGCRSKWPRCLRSGFVASRLLGLLVWIPPEACMFVYYECCVLSGRDLCVRPITHQEESYRVLRVWMWFGNLSVRKPRAHRGWRAINNSYGHSSLIGRSMKILLTCAVKLEVTNRAQQEMFYCYDDYCYLP